MLINENSLIPLRETNFASKRKRISDGIMESIESYNNNLEMENNEKLVKEEFKINEMAENIGSFNTRKNRRERSLFLERKENTVRELLIENLADIFYTSIILDEDFKAIHETNILEKGKYFFEEMFKQNMLSTNDFINSENEFLREMYVNTFDLVESSIEDANVNIFEESKKKSTSDKDNVSNEIKKKVVKVIKYEKDLAGKKEEEKQNLEESQLIYNRKEKPSLFKAIMKSNSKQLLENKNFNMDQIMAESIIQYTLLETLNTLKLITFDNHQIENLISNFIQK